MGVGYQTSALHQITSRIIDPDAPEIEVPPEMEELLYPGAKWVQSRVHSPTIVEIVAWRDALAGKVRGQLGELLTWDEATTFWASEDVGASSDVGLRYVAALADEGGDCAVRKLVDKFEPLPEEIIRAIRGAQQRRLAGRFPHLVVVGRYWLPFHANTIIEAADWLGHGQGIGSTYQLEKELAQVRAMIFDADPRVAEGAGRGHDSPAILWKAWEACEVIGSVLAEATARHLPFWTTG